jgi:hypothetical protein
MKSPQRPRTLSKENALGRAFRFRTARKSVTVARLWPEKKGRGERVFYGGLFRVLLGLNCMEIIRIALKINALSVAIISDIYYD